MIIAKQQRRSEVAALFRQLPRPAAGDLIGESRRQLLFVRQPHAGLWYNALVFFREACALRLKARTKCRTQRLKMRLKDLTKRSGTPRFRPFVFLYSNVA